MINFLEKMEVLAIFYKLLKEADIILKLKNGLMRPAKLTWDSQITSSSYKAPGSYFLSLYSSCSPFGTIDSLG